MLTILLLLTNLAACPAIIDVMQNETRVARIRVSSLESDRKTVRVASFLPVTFVIQACDQPYKHFEKIEDATEKKIWTVEVGALEVGTKVR